jgi:regulator of sigma E protease
LTLLHNPIVPGVLLLGLVIFIHELGHFIAAKARGVKVLRFSLGFGPALLAFHRGETEYRLSWVPLGGYVQMAGDSPDETGEMPSGKEEFLSHPWVGRIVIAAAGPAANLVGAFLVMVATAMVGVTYPDFDSRLGAMPDTSFAVRAGAHSGDRVVAIQGTPVATFHDIDLAYAKVRGDHAPVRVTLERDRRPVDLTLPPGEVRPFVASLEPAAIPPVIGSVMTGMPAYKAGLREGDRIVSVAGRPVSTWTEIPQALHGRVDQPVPILVDRGGSQFAVTIKPINADGNTQKNGMIGIGPLQPKTYVEHFSFLQSWVAGFRATTELVPAVYSQMWLTITRPLYYREYLGGPLFIAQAASEQAKHGLDSWLQLVAWISVAVMAFNLLPLPLLDGGHILLALIEALRRHAISARTYLRFQKAGLMVVGALFVFIIANDFNRVIQRQRALGGVRSAPQESPVAPTPP